MDRYFGTAIFGCVALLVFMVGFASYMDRHPTMPTRYDITCKDGRHWENVESDYNNWHNIFVVHSGNDHVIVNSLKCVRNIHR